MLIKASLFRPAKRSSFSDAAHFLIRSMSDGQDLRGAARPCPQPGTQNAGSIVGKQKNDGQKTVARVGAIYLSRPSPAKYCRQK